MLADPSPSLQFPHFSFMGHQYSIPWKARGGGIIFGQNGKGEKLQCVLSRIVSLILTKSCRISGVEMLYVQKAPLRELEFSFSKTY